MESRDAPRLCVFLTLVLAAFVGWQYIFDHDTADVIFQSVWKQTLQQTWQQHARAAAAAAAPPAASPAAAAAAPAAAGAAEAAGGPGGDGRVAETSRAQLAGKEVPPPKKSNPKKSTEYLLEQRSFRHGRFRLVDLGGAWPALRRFAELLMEDLPESLARGKQCDVIMFTGWLVSVPFLRVLNLTQPTTVPRVYLVVNQEPPENGQVWNRLNKQYVHSAVILGNWWSATQAEFSDEKKSSIWLPFASAYFADLMLSSPMDLLQPRNLSVPRPVGPKGTGCHHWPSEQPRMTVVYQQHSCFTNKNFVHVKWKNYREKFWDALNSAMIRELSAPGFAVGDCNGERDLGSRKLPKIVKFTGGHACLSPRLPMVALENTISAAGYVTEKPINALLAGAIPIYAGSEQAPDVINRHSYLLLRPGENDEEVLGKVIGALRDPAAYERLSQARVISDEQLRRFFSWHPAVWPTHGDSLRQRIVSELDRLCK